MRYNGTRLYRLKKEPFLTVLARHNMSLREFCREEDINSGYLSQMLNGYRFPSGKYRKALMNATSLTFDELFEENR